MLGDRIERAAERAHVDREDRHGPLQEQVGDEREGEQAHERAVAQQPAPVAAGRAQVHLAAARQRQREERAGRDQAGGDREHHVEPRLRRARGSGREPARRLKPIEEARKADHQRQEADGSPDAHAPEGVRAVAARERERHGRGRRHDRGREEREQQRREHERREALREAERQVARRRAEGEQHEHARARTRAVGELAPERLRERSDEREHGEHDAHLRAREAGVLAQVEAEVRKEQAEAAEAEEPDAGHGEAAGHRECRGRYTVPPWIAPTRGSKNSSGGSRAQSRI